MSSPRLRSSALAVALVLGGGSVALAAPPRGAGTAGSLETPDYRIVTDSSHYNLNTGIFDMPHRVRFYRPGTDAVSDKANGNMKLGTATLIGNVVVHDSGNAPESGEQAYRGGGPATLTCNQLDIDSHQKLYTATGNVHFSQGSRSGSAEKAILNRATGVLHLEGNVHLNDSGSTVSTDSLDYNLNTRDVDMHGSPTTVTQPVSKPVGPVASPAAQPKPKLKPTSAPHRQP